MADAKHALELLECGIRMLIDVRLKFLWVQFAPMPPTGFGGQCSRWHGVQITVHRTPAQIKATGGHGFGTSRLNKLYHPFPQDQCICFHARKSITLCPNVNVKRYNPGFRTLLGRRPDALIMRKRRRRNPAVPISTRFADESWFSP